MKEPVFHSRYVCSEGCSFSAELTEIVYRCPSCGSLLDVEHDLPALKTRSAQQWKDLFSTR